MSGAVSRVPSGSVDGNQYEAAIEWMLIALLLFMPLSFGAVAAWSETVVVAGVAVMLLLLLIRLRQARSSGEGPGPVWSWVYVPMGVFIALAFLQMAPLPIEWARWLSPQSVGLRQELLGEQFTALTATSLSLYPAGTEHHLRLILAISGIFLVTLHLFRDAESITRLLIAITVIGAGFALLAAAQNLTGSDRIYWLYETGLRRAGPFMNHSHYSQFMNLSIGAALALLLIQIRRIFGDGDRGPAMLLRQGEDARVRVLWALAAVILAGALTILYSMSRGGALSMFIAGGLTTLVIAVNSRKRVAAGGWVLTGLGAALFAATLYIGFDPVFDRLATLMDIERSAGGRWTILRDLSQVWAMFPAIGTGLGTHEIIYPMFDSSATPRLASHAENEYAQVLTEMGIVGLVCVLAVAVMLIAAYVRGVRRQSHPVHAAVYGLGFGLVAVMIHSFSDFGQHLPAIAGLTAVTGALLINVARCGPGGAVRTRPKNGGPSSPAFLQARRVAPTGFTMALFVGLAWATLGANQARVAEAHWREALRTEEWLAANDWQGTNAEYARLIENAEAASDLQPRDIHYRHWLNVYRWRSLARLEDPETGELVMTERTLGFVDRIVADLHRARVLAPTFGPTWSLAGQLEVHVLGRSTGAGDIRTGVRLAPHDANVCFAAAELAIHERNWQASLDYFERALALQGSLFERVAELYREVDRPDLALQLADDQPRRLLRLATVFEEVDAHRDWADAPRERALNLILATTENQEAEASASDLALAARMLAEREEYERAADLYRQALTQDYSRVSWRLALARVLRQTGRVNDAMHEARICLRLRPEMAAARNLIAELSSEAGPAIREQ